MKALITVSSVQVDKDVVLVGGSGDGFVAITRDVGTLSDAIQTIADTAAIQTYNLSQVTAAVGDLDRSTQQWQTNLTER